MNGSDLEPDNFFTTNGKDIWKLESCFKVPSCTLKNIETGNVVTFGMNGLMAGEYHKIVMPTIKDKNA